VADLDYTWCLPGVPGCYLDFTWTPPGQVGECKVLKMSPFQIIYGTDLKGIPTAFPWISAPAVENTLNELMKIRQEALAAHELARQQMIQRKPGDFVPFEKGDLVWLLLQSPLDHGT
jgi:hypothetical protein